MENTSRCRTEKRKERLKKITFTRGGAAQIDDRS